MALTGNFTFKKNETIDCPIIIDDVSSHGSQILVIRIPVQHGILTSRPISGFVGVFTPSIGFEVVGTAAQINGVLATLRYQNDYPAFGMIDFFQSQVVLSARDRSNLYTGNKTITGTVTFTEFQYPAVTWQSAPVTTYNVPITSSNYVVRMPNVNATNVGLLSAKISPKTSADDDRGRFVVSESWRDKGQLTLLPSIDTSETEFRGSADTVNAFLQSMVWQPFPAFSTDIAKYTVSVSDGRTNYPAYAEVSLVPTPGMFAPDVIYIPNTGTIDPGVRMGGATTSGINTITLTPSSTTSVVFTSTAAVDPNISVSISGSVVTITANASATTTQINTVLTGIRAAAGAGATATPIFTLSCKLSNSVSGLLDDKVVSVQVKVRVTNLIGRSWNEDNTYIFNPIMQVIGSVVDETMTFALTAVGNLFSGSISSTAGGTWNAGTKTWTVTGSISSVNSVLTGLRYTPVANYDRDFDVTVSITNSQENFNGSFKMTGIPDGIKDLGLVVSAWPSVITYNPTSPNTFASPAWSITSSQSVFNPITYKDSNGTVTAGSNFQVIIPQFGVDVSAANSSSATATSPSSFSTLLNSATFYGFYRGTQSAFIGGSWEAGDGAISNTAFWQTTTGRVHLNNGIMEGQITIDNSVNRRMIRDAFGYTYKTGVNLLDRRFQISGPDASTNYLYRYFYVRNILLDEFSSAEFPNFTTDRGTNVLVAVNPNESYTNSSPNVDVLIEYPSSVVMTFPGTTGVTITTLGNTQTLRGRGLAVNKCLAGGSFTVTGQSTIAITVTLRNFSTAAVIQSKTMNATYVV